jgi:hypothetical protein
VNGGKPQNECREPENASISGPVASDCEHQTNEASNRSSPTEPPVRVETWLRRLSEPLTVVTLLLFVATVGLVWETRVLVNDARESSERQLRAYVLPTSRGQIDDFGIEKAIKATLEFKNSGQTPAYKLRIKMLISAGTFPLPKNLPPEPIDPKIRLILGPGTTYMTVAQMVRPLNLEEMNQIKAGIAAVYVFGEIDYWDAFDRHRCTRFRYFMGGNRAEMTVPSGTLTEYPEGNDEDC